MKKKLIILGSAISVVGYMNAQTTLTALKTKMQGATNTIQNQRDGNFNQISSTGYYLPSVEVHYKFDTLANNWEAPHDSVTISYYSGWPNEGKVKEKIHHSYDSFTNSWDPQNKEYNNYTNNGLLVATRYYYYSSPNWQPNFRDSIVYNSNNKRIERIWQGWDNVSNNWGNMTGKATYSYNSNNKLIAQENFQWDWITNTLTPYSKTTYSYNAAMQPTLELSMNWDNATSTYTNNYQYVYKYDSNGKINLAYWLSYNSSSNSWDTTTRIANITWYKWYGADIEDINSKNLISNYEFQLRIGSGFYLPVYKGSFAYDPIDDKIVTEDEYSWDAGTNSWKKENGSRQYQYTRDPSYNNMVTESIEKYWYNHLNAYRNYYKISYRNPQHMTSVKNFDNSINGYLIYPNPSSDQLYISINNMPSNEELQVKISNLQGQEIINQKLLNHQSLNVSDLSNGIYILQIQTSNGKNAQTKFVKN